MINEALAYFKSEAGYQRLFTLFKKKYESLGRFGGTVKTADFTDEELEGIARFFGLTPSELRSKGKISISHFENHLQRTKFEEIRLKELLEAYFREPLRSNKEKRQAKENEQNQFLTELKSDFSALQFWLEYVQKKKPDTYWIYRLIESSSEEFVNWMHQLNQAITQMPYNYERLPMFSQRLTKDPHAFDLNTNLGKLFIHVLSVDSQKEGSVVVPTDSEGMNDLLLTYRLLRDDITNYVSCANLMAETKEGAQPMWEAAARVHSVMNVPLRELVKLTKAYPNNINKSVWIVENSGVFSSLLDQAPATPLICTHGQYRLAGLLLIDFLVKEGCTIYYSGDIDPEGLGMAERLLNRHPQHVRLWKMNVNDYLASLSELELPEERLSKLNRISTPTLIPVIEEMRQRKKAGYQEALVNEMVSELIAKNN
ncbi:MULTISPECIES: TIGR02679 family protein [Allobacillus]|uniref:TIGR02679 family protein n=1 Tax=Allobacillus salarius TaxID=1955272 RepID=A0A556PDC3_9BACI|nr:TIGR02679 family protein [Allobacillus salarius]TSJ62387.1 TIGR02679 family protein [Allobacillus salarius]